MIRKVIKYQDFKEISKEHEIFVWHFGTKTQSCIAVRPVLLDIPVPQKSCLGGNTNDMETILEVFKNLPYFESFTHESVDFLMNLGIPASRIWKDGIFSPLILGFKNGVLIDSTFNHCYCETGFTEIVLSLNPEIEVFL